MAKGQKEAVVEQVLLHLPNFKKYQDNAILLLSNAQLDSIKINILADIVSGVIKYGKSLQNGTEVRTYARSMVMNHLKKAKELNGGHAYVTNPNNVPNAGTSVNTPRTIRQKLKLAPKGVNPDLLTEELKEYVKTLVT